MEQEIQKKKGLSTGCIVGIVVVAVIVVVIIVGGITCYVYRQELAKKGAEQVLIIVKAKVAETATAEVDTVTFNAVADGFTTRLNEEDFADNEERMMELSAFLTQIQPLAGVDSVSVEQVARLQEAMVGLYPDLADLVVPMPIDSLPAPDSVLSQ
jgi:hypothetical protein